MVISAGLSVFFLYGASVGIIFIRSTLRMTFLPQNFECIFFFVNCQMDVVSEILASMLMVVPLCSSGGLAFISYIWSL